MNYKCRKIDWDIKESQDISADSPQIASLKFVRDNFVNKGRISYSIFVVQVEDQNKKFIVKVEVNPTIEIGILNTEEII